MNTVSAATIMGRPLGMAVAEASAIVGLDAYAIVVEVCASRGPAFFQLVGLAEASVREARVRVASALAKMGVLIDEHAITINLAPAGVKKTGAALDLAMALGVLSAVGELSPEALANTLLIGELSLDGRLRPVSGVLPQLDAARRRGIKRAILPSENAAEAGLVRGLDTHGATSLSEALQHLTGTQPLPLVPTTRFCPVRQAGIASFAEIRGQYAAKRCLEIAAAGHHNLLMIGPPGSGKTLLARALPALLPPLAYDEAVETTKVHSVAGLVDPNKGIVDVRPFRAPHHSVSEAGLVGGGELPRPGEISLAHNGVLFLDELAEFRRNALEALRQPLEDGKVSIIRARARACFPVRPLVVAAVNPCPCGYWGHPRRPCRCSPKLRQSYLARLSGPLLDRLDIHTLVPPVPMAALSAPAPSDDLAAITQRIERARAEQRLRFEQGQVGVSVNAGLSLSELEKLGGGQAQTRRLLSQAVDRLGLSARAFVKVLRVARTIADLEGVEAVTRAHLGEAIQGRLLEPQALKQVT